MSTPAETRKSRTVLQRASDEVRIMLVASIETLRTHGLIPPPGEVMVDRSFVLEISTRSGYTLTFHSLAGDDALRFAAGTRSHTQPAPEIKKPTKGQLAGIESRRNALDLTVERIDAIAAEHDASDWRTVRTSATALITALDRRPKERG